MQIIKHYTLIDYDLSIEDVQKVRQSLQVIAADEPQKIVLGISDVQPLRVESINEDVVAAPVDLVRLYDASLRTVRPQLAVTECVAVRSLSETSSWRYEERRYRYTLQMSVFSLCSCLVE